MSGIVMRCIALGVAAALLPATAVAESAHGGGTARASLNFRVVVPVVLRVREMRHPERIEVQARHVEQGYIEVEDGTSVVVTSNNGRGFTLAVAFDTSLVSGVEVRVGGERFDASPGAGAFNVRTTAPLNQKQLQIGYRLRLDPRAIPGSYRWPVNLEFGLASI